MVMSCVCVCVCVFVCMYVCVRVFYRPSEDLNSSPQPSSEDFLNVRGPQPQSSNENGSKRSETKIEGGTQKFKRVLQRDVTHESVLETATQFRRYYQHTFHTCFRAPSTLRPRRSGEFRPPHQWQLPGMSAGCLLSTFFQEVITVSGK